MDHTWRLKLSIAITFVIIGGVEIEHDLENEDPTGQCLEKELGSRTRVFANVETDFERDVEDVDNYEEDNQDVPENLNRVVWFENCDMVKEPSLQQLERS
jgi:hypothetical protein